MKWQQTLSLAALSALSVSLVSSCVKDLPYDRLQREVNSCPILVLDAFEQYVPGIPVEFARYTITYNKAGDPVKMIFTSGAYNTADDRYFRYDYLGRLSDFALTPHGSSGSLIWNRYGYPDRNTITDTIFDYAGDVDSAEPPHASLDTYLHLFKLDDLGRIIKSTSYYGSFVTTEPVSILTFAYDDKGDMIRPGVTYDDKINPYQTNKVWMLTDNDYSVHNPVNGPLGSNGSFGIGGPISIPSYNALGLPLEMDGNINLFIDNFGDQLKIEYGCDSVPSKDGSMGR